MQGDRRAACQMQTSLGIQTGKALKSDCECLTDYKNTSDCMKRTQKATHTHTHARTTFITSIIQTHLYINYKVISCLEPIKCKCSDSYT